MRNMRPWVVILLAGTIGGCGQKGPLTLPDSPKHKKVAPSPRTPAESARPSETPATSATDATASPSDATQKP